MKIWRYIFGVLTLILSLQAIALLQLPDTNLHLIACNVGQGDAILITYKKTQILIDGGPDKKVLKCLGKYLPFWDRDLELVILTHPDSDHLGGLTEVFKNYKVDNFLTNPVTISNPEYKVPKKWMKNAFIATVGQRLRVGLIYLDTLSPQAGVADTAGKSTNDTSIVNLVRFGKFKAILTGDATGEVLDDIAKKWTDGHLDYIKISHHGSKYGTTVNSLNAFMPRLAVISVGKNNYGHPSSDVLHMLRDLDISYLRTDEDGNIEVITDGNSFFIKKEKN